MSSRSPLVCRLRRLGDGGERRQRPDSGHVVSGIWTGRVGAIRNADAFQARKQSATVYKTTADTIHGVPDTFREAGDTFREVVDTLRNSPRHHEWWIRTSFRRWLSPFSRCTTVQVSEIRTLKTVVVYLQISRRLFAKQYSSVCRRSSSVSQTGTELPREVAIRLATSRRSVRKQTATHSMRSG